MNDTPPASPEAVRSLARASRMLERACGDLSLAHYRVLSAIAAGDERASRVAARYALGKPAISAHVEALCRRGLLTRTEHSTDQRVVTLELTAQGQDALREAETQMGSRLGRVCARTPEPQQVVQVLEWLGTALDEAIAELNSRSVAAR